MRHTHEHHPRQLLGRLFGHHHPEFGSRDQHFGPRGPGRGRGGFGRFEHDEERSEGRGRRRFFDSAELRLILLKLIGEQPRHGYDLIGAIEELTAGNYIPSPGVVYPALSLLEDLNHIQAAASEGSRKAFSITVEGEAELAANAEKIAALLARLKALAATRDALDSAPVRRAMENLRSALRNRLHGGDIAKDTLHDIAAILDEAAQRIERL